MVEAWTREGGDEFARRGDPGNPDSLRDEARLHNERLRALSRKVFENFCRLVRLCTPKHGLPTVERTRPAREGGMSEEAKVERAWQRYRELLSRRQLKCGVTCPLERIGRCTGGCW